MRLYSSNLSFPLHPISYFFTFNLTVSKTGIFFDRDGVPEIQSYLREKISRRTILRSRELHDKTLENTIQRLEKRKSSRTKRERWNFWNSKLIKR
jgi:hypothetical protein